MIKWLTLLKKYVIVIVVQKTGRNVIVIKQRKDNLTKDDELALGRRIQAMVSIKAEEDFSEDSTTKEQRETILSGHDALEVLIGNYINLARDIAHKHHKRTGTRYGIEDLIQDAIGALVKAAYAYDPDKNCRLSTYAFYGITKEVSKTINFQRFVRMPENKMGEYITISNAQRDYRDMSEESKSEYSNELDYVYKNVGKLKKEEVNLVLENMQPQVSLNSLIYDGDGEFMDVIEDENSEDDFQVVDALDENVERIINELTPYQRDLVAFEYEAFPASMSYSDFLDKYEITDKKVKREVRKAVTKMVNIAKKHDITLNIA